MAGEYLAAVVVVVAFDQKVMLGLVTLPLWLLLMMMKCYYLLLHRWYC